MADQKISDLAAVTTPVGTDTLEIVQSGVNKKMTIAQLLAMGSSPLTSTTVTSTTGMATSGGAFAATRAAAANAAFQAKVSGDSQQRLEVGADGKMSWGTGAASADVTLERGGTSELQVTGDLAVVGDFDINQVGESASAWLDIRRDAGYVGSIRWQTGGVNRFSLYVDNVAESGSDVGSDLHLWCNGDAGGSLVEVLKVTRASGDAVFGAKLTSTGDFDVNAYLTVAAASGNLATQGTIGGQAGAWFRESALALAATTGHVYIPTSAGVPTGVPATKTGQVAIQFDSTNDDLYVYDGSWIKVALS